MSYTIGQIAILLNIPTSTLRYYDKKGLLPFVSRDENGNRQFDDQDYEWLKIIECLKTSGLSLDAIKTYIQLAQLGDETLEERLQLFLAQRKALEEKQAALEESLQIIQFKCWYYETAKQYGTVDVPKNMPLDELPQSLQATRRRLRPRTPH